MKQLLIPIMAISLVSCGIKKEKKMEKSMNQSNTEKTITTSTPLASEFVKSPLRNRIKLELNAPISEVWNLVGKLERMPEYSSGLKDLKANYNNNNDCTDYTCYFYPMEEGGKVSSHSETIKWYKKNVGYASLAHEPNVLGLQQSLNLVTLVDNKDNTILLWDVHFTAENEEMIKMNTIGFQQALNVDIAQNLIKKFGGKVLESFIKE